MNLKAYESYTGNIWLLATWNSWYFLNYFPIYDTLENVFLDKTFPLRKEKLLATNEIIVSQTLFYFVFKL